MGQNKIYNIIGARGKGKTPFIIGGTFERGLAKIFLQKGMSTLIIDEVDHPSYRHLPCLLPDEFNKLNTHVGIYRTLASLHHIDELIKKIAFDKLIWNTFIVFEDCSKYIPQSFGKVEKALIGNSKQQNCCLAFMNWSWGNTPPDLFRHSNYLVIFPTSDHPECRTTYIRGCLKECSQAYDLVVSGKKPYLIVETGI